MTEKPFGEKLQSLFGYKPKAVAQDVTIDKPKPVRMLRTMGDPGLAKTAEDVLWNVGGGATGKTEPVQAPEPGAWGQVNG